MNPTLSDGAQTEPVVPLVLGAHWYEDDPGGLHRYVADLFTALRRDGLHPRAVVSGPAASAPFGVVAGGHFARPFPLRLWGYTRALNRTALTGVTVIDAHFAFYAAWPVVMGRLKRMPLVVHFQGPWAQESEASGDPPGWRLSAKRKTEMSVYRRARAIVVLSHAFKELLVQGYGVAPWLIHVVPPGVDLHHFAPGSRADARRRVDLPAGVRVVAVVRRLVARMGLDVLIDTWAQLQPDDPDSVLLVVGDGPDRRSLEEHAARSGVGGSVRFLGKVDEETLVRCYQAADLSVVPTLALEGFGLVVVESLACGTPVVATDTGGLPEVLGPLDPSLIVAAGDAGALTRRIRAGLDGTQPLPDEDRCRAHAESFTWPAVAERHRAIYARAARPASTRLRVVYLDHCPRLSGGELALLRLLPALDVEAHVILAETGPLLDELEKAGVSTEVMPIAESAGSVGRELVRPSRLPVSALAHSAVYVGRLAARLRQLEPDLVHTNSLKAALYGGASARLASVPVVWHVRDRISDDYLPVSARRLVRAAARILPAAVIANSQATLDTLGPAGVGGSAIASPLGFPPSTTARPAGQRPFRVGIVGRLDRWKGQHIFLDAFARAFPSGPEEAVIVGASLFGENGYDSELRRQATSLAIEDRVE
ncbi:MAG: glycosyltransferase family 4 protein, partial [Nocardioides sp.]